MLDFGRRDSVKIKYKIVSIFMRKLIIYNVIPHHQSKHNQLKLYTCYYGINSKFIVSQQYCGQQLRN